MHSTENVPCNVKSNWNLEERGLLLLSYDLVDFPSSDHHNTGEAVIFCCHVLWKSNYPLKAVQHQLDE